MSLNWTNLFSPILPNGSCRYTTLSYRAPEMVNLYNNKIITTKADIWVSETSCRPSCWKYSNWICCVHGVRWCLFYCPLCLSVWRGSRVLCSPRLWDVCCTSCASSRCRLVKARWPSVTAVSPYQTTPATRMICTALCVSFYCFTMCGVFVFLFFF